MVRAAILALVLAILANASCFGSCATNTCAQPSGSCHHQQKKSMEPCAHHLLVADNTAQSDGSPLVVAIPVTQLIELIAVSEPLAPQSVAPLPPLLSSSITILKI